MTRVAGGLARACFGLAILASLVVLFSPGSDVPPSPPGVDKLVHGSLFAVLAATGLWTGMAFRRLAAVLVAYAAASEVIQWLATFLGRDGSVGDLAADVAGVLLGGLLWTAIARRRRSRR